MRLFNSEEFKKMVDEIYDVQNQEKTIVYATQLQKYALEKYFNVKLDLDDCIYQTVYGRYRFLGCIDNAHPDLSFLENQNQMYIINGIYEPEEIK